MTTDTVLQRQYVEQLRKVHKMALQHQNNAESTEINDIIHAAELADELAEQLSQPPVFSGLIDWLQTVPPVKSQT